MKKAVKQYSDFVSNFEEVKQIAERYKNVRNYVYSRYSGINSLLLLNPYKKKIRDAWVKTGFAKQWGLMDRYWKMALDEAIANIKSLWSNLKNKVKETVNKNSNITEDEKTYIRYVLKNDELLYSILTRQTFVTPKKLEKLLVRENYLWNLINRYVRRYKSIPYSKTGKTFQIDADMYAYKKTPEGLVLEMASLTPRKRLIIGLKDTQIHTGNLRIVLKERLIEIHSAVDVKQKKLWKTNNVIGIDKGYKTLFAASNGKMYGSGLNHILSKETERLSIKNARRNRIWDQIKNLKEAGNFSKAKKIEQHNFGKKKYNRQKNKYNEQVKSLINNEINNIIRNDLPSEIVSEDLSFVSWKGKYPKHINRKLSRWMKGFIRERLEFKCQEYNIKYTLVNAAYTSQLCHKCQCFGTRTGERFVCATCGPMNADLNASHNIKERKDDKEITIFTPYKKVKIILEKRQKVFSVS